MSESSLLRVEDLRVHFDVGPRRTRSNEVLRAVDGVTFDLPRGSTLGLVGESGCGKSTTGRAIAQLLRPTSGRVTFDGEELTRHWRRSGGVYRWDKYLKSLRQRVQVIFQDPYASLDPRMNVEELIGEPLDVFRRATGAERRKRIQELLDRVGLPPESIRRYPHEFSGGQRQRIGIARAIALSPDLIIADEPVSALDVSIQAQILNLLKSLQRDLGLTYVFIAHDLASVRYISDRIAVMYLGRIVELGEADLVCRQPTHPYTKALLASMLAPDPTRERSRALAALSGEVPSLIAPPRGCPFHPRCAERFAVCDTHIPQAHLVDGGREVRCHLVDPLPLM